MKTLETCDFTVTKAVNTISKTVFIQFFHYCTFVFAFLFHFFYYPFRLNTITLSVTLKNNPCEWSGINHVHVCRTINYLIDIPIIRASFCSGLVGTIGLDVSLSKHKIFMVMLEE